MTHMPMVRLDDSWWDDYLRISRERDLPPDEPYNGDSDEEEENEEGATNGRER